MTNFHFYIVPHKHGGFFASSLLRLNEDLALLVVDPYMRQAPGSQPVHDEMASEAALQTVNKLVRQFQPRVHFMLTTSERAAPWIADESLVFVFIDAMHDRSSVSQDIKLWWKKVRRGGFLSGHDYNHEFPGVVEAVDSFCREASLLLFLGPDSVWWVAKE